MAEPKNAEDLFRLLEASGIPAGYARSMLPAWWDDVDSDSPASLAELRLSLARNLGIDILELSSDAPRVTFKLPHVRKLKRSIRYNDQALTPAVSIAIAAARIVAAACPHSFSPLPNAPTTRQLVLKRLQAKYVSLRSLILTCWSHGIPVIHLGSIPVGMPKMDGLVATIDGRPVIVLAKRTDFSAWMAFILAHEMGHIALGHFSDDAVLVDETLDETTMTLKEEDPEERQADTYALSLLGGDADFDDALRNLDSPKQLALRAMEVHRQEAVDAGHVLLRHAYRENDWDRAIAALKGLDQERSAIRNLHEAMFHETDCDRLSESTLEYLAKVTGAKSHLG